MDQENRELDQVIVCPWCGTHYTSFQSNCDRCGGPLPAPRPARVDEAELPPADVAEVEIPPPPPRQISDEYRRQLLLGPVIGGCGVGALLGFSFMFGGFMLVAGLASDIATWGFHLGVEMIIGISIVIILFGLGLLILVGGIRSAHSGRREAEKLIDVLRHGEAVVGQIVSVQPDYASLSNGLPQLTISYQFQWAGRDYQNQFITHLLPGPPFEPGRRVCVLCLPNAPEHNTIYPHP